jgi:hypothetical protein
MTSNNGGPPFTLRKRVNPEETCLRCHGSYPFEIMGLTGPWHEQQADLEPEGTPNGCLTCHAAIRTEPAQRDLSEQGRDREGGRELFGRLLRLPWRSPVVPDQLSLSAQSLAGHGQGCARLGKNRPTKSDPRYAISGK